MGPLRSQAMQPGVRASRAGGGRSWAKEEDKRGANGIRGSEAGARGDPRNLLAHAMRLRHFSCLESLVRT